MVSWGLRGKTHLHEKRISVQVGCKDQLDTHACPLDHSESFPHLTNHRLCHLRWNAKYVNPWIYIVSSKTQQSSIERRIKGGSAQYVYVMCHHYILTQDNACPRLVNWRLQPQLLWNAHVVLLLLKWYTASREELLTNTDNSQLQIWLDPQKILTKGFSVVYVVSDVQHTKRLTPRKAPFSKWRPSGP